VRELAQQLRSDGGIDVRILNPGGKNLSIGARAREIRTLRRGILLSIHHDSAQPKYLKKWKYYGKTRRFSDKFSGYSLFVSDRTIPYVASKKLGLDIGEILYRNGLRRSLHHSERIRGEGRPILSKKLGLFRYDGLAILRRTRIPAVLIEVGVIINRDEELRLSDRKYRKNIIGAIAQGVKKFCHLSRGTRRNVRHHKNPVPYYEKPDMPDDKLSKGFVQNCSRYEYDELKRLKDIEAWDEFLAICKRGKLARLARFQQKKLLRQRTRERGREENNFPPPDRLRQHRNTEQLNRERELQREIRAVKKELRRLKRPNLQKDRQSARQ